MRLGILRTPNLGAANLAQVLLGGAWIPMWFFLSLYLQQVLDLGAFESGAALLPMTLTIALLMIVVAPRVIARAGIKTPIVAGMLIWPPAWSCSRSCGPTAASSSMCCPAR
jgi:hypothetical protein